MPLSWKFLSDLKLIEKTPGLSVFGNLKTNLRRIGQKITDCDDEGNAGVYMITDMLRATIVVKEPHHLNLAYQELQKISSINVIKITNHMK